ncbi:MAG: universal stress protein [Bacteroidota bacterium]|nr:universal stress protein [Ferruginibacter sp.]
MKKILIALDYDPSAEQIAKAGHELAKATQAQTVLIHIIADALYYSSLDYSPVMGYTGFSSPDMVPLVDIQALKDASLDFLEQTKRHLNDDSIQVIVGDGDCADAILETANEIGADVIVLGSHSRRGLDKILMGSISEKVLNHTSIPLLMIPTKRAK